MEELSKNYDLTNITDFKEFLYRKIDLQTETSILTGFTFDVKVFSLSIAAQINLSNLLNFPDGSFPLTLITNDETVYYLSLADKENFYQSSLTSKYTALQAGINKKQEVLASTTIEELQIILATL